MAKPILKLTTIVLFVTLFTWGCSNNQKVSPEKDLTLPDFSFVGLSEPLADKKNIRVTVHVKIPYDELQFIRESDGFLARYEVSVNIADSEQERIDGTIWNDSLVVAEYQDTRKSEQTALAVKSFIVPAAELTISVRVTDLYTKKSRILSDGIDQSDMYHGDLALGNIMIIDNKSPENSQVLLDRSFYEIVDTLRFKARIIGEHPPYKITYELLVKEEIKKKHSFEIDVSGPIDSLLSFIVPLNDMQYANYSLFLNAQDGKDNHVMTKSNFRVRIKGLNFDVGNLDEAAKQLIYITNERQIRAIMTGTAQEQAKNFSDFWDSLDPSPGTTVNELMDEYYRRVSFSIEAFTVVQDGWRTDRGMIYILFGTPDDIQRSPFEMNRKPYQVWEYYRLGKQFVFIDVTGFGDYRLDHTYLNENDWNFRY